MTPISFKGMVEFQLAGEEGWQPLQQFTRIQVGSRIRTGEMGSVGFWFEDGSELYLNPNTDLGICQHDGGR